MGTYTLHQPNEIHLLTFNEDANRVDLQQVFRGPSDGSFEINEISDLRACPYQSQRGLFACSHKGIISLFKMSEELFDDLGFEEKEPKDMEEDNELIQEMCKL